jgi:spore coat protein U-like protein
MMRVRLSRLVLTLILGSATLVFADVKTLQLPVVASVNPPFDASIDPLSFGEIPDTTFPVTANGQIRVAAPAGSQVSIAANSGQNFANNTRRLSCGATGFISYQLFLANGTTPWGDGSPALGQPGTLVATGGVYNIFPFTAITVATPTPLPTATCFDIVTVTVSF